MADFYNKFILKVSSLEKRGLVNNMGNINANLYELIPSMPPVDCWSDCGWVDVVCPPTGQFGYGLRSL